MAHTQGIKQGGIMTSKGIDRRARAATLGLLAAVLTSWAGPSRAGPLLCAWDMLGKGGEVHTLAQDYATAMAREGVHFQVRTFTDERLVAEDFRAGQCAAAILTGFRVRPFNQVTGSLDSLGSAVVVRDGRVDLAASYEVLRKLIQVFASPQAASLMTEGQYEVGGILPVGAAYPMLRERFEITPQTLAGKRVAAFDHDRVQGMLIQKMGAQAISSDIVNVGAKFNNGLVDLIHMPAIAFKPFELAKGMGSKGGVLRMPVMIPTLQVIFNRSMLPAALGAPSRVYWAGLHEGAMKAIQRAESEVPARLWFELPPDHVQPYVDVLRDGRIAGAKAGLYSWRTLNLMKKARCQASPAMAECSVPTESP